MTTKKAIVNATIPKKTVLYLLMVNPNSENLDTRNSLIRTPDIKKKYIIEE